jgi:hypothetical protein
MKDNGNTPGVSLSYMKTLVHLAREKELEPWVTGLMWFLSFRFWFNGSLNDFFFFFYHEASMIIKLELYIQERDGNMF